MLSLIFNMHNVMHFDKYGLDGLGELPKVHLLVATALNSTDDSNEFSISSIKTIMTQETIQTEKVDIALPLAIK